MKNILTYAFLMLGMAMASCSKSDDLTINSNEKGQVKIKFDPIVNDKKLVLNDYIYTNSNKETFNISMAKFFVSNIKLKTTSGNVYTVPQKESYFLIDVADLTSLQPNIQIPEGEYTELEFNLGIDSLTNTLPVEERTGVLDVSNGMYWGWNSGYIFFKLEGNSPQSKNSGGKFAYHIGLFGGYNSPTVNNNKIIKINLQQAGIAKVKKDLSADIHLMVDFGKVFDGPTKISINEYSTVMTAGPHQQIATNYATMFTHDHTHNFQKTNITH